MRFFSAFIQAVAGWDTGLLGPLGRKQTTTRNQEARHNQKPNQTLEVPSEYLARDIIDPEWTEERGQHEKALETRLRKRIEQLEGAVAELQSNNRRLRESEKLYRSLVQENISDILMVIEADGTVRLFESPAIERVLGYRPDGCSSPRGARRLF